MNNRRARTLTASVALGLALAACASGGSGGGDQSQVGKSATISHIHGLGVDATGTPYVATHYGLIKAGASGAWVYASADTIDHMGFSLHAGDGMMYRSGHSPSKPSLGVQSSTDGARWTHLSDVADPPVDFHAMAVSLADSKTLWGWDSGGRGTFRSTDAGKTWTRVEAKGIDGQIYVLAAPAEANVVLAGTASGLYRSTDGGASWQAVAGVGGGWVIGIGADPSDSKHMLVFTQRGMKSTTDGGATWTEAGGGLPSDAEIASISISPGDARTVYAADSSKIYKTIDGGKTWTALATG
ncbi:MAG TPA: hypothetical protein VGB64_13455 [Actinomycetota bacterium]